MTAELIPDWVFEQDYLVFLSFFGWMLLGLLAWTKPLSEKEDRRIPWLWFGYYAFSQAFSDFLRTLSFSDPFFRVFNMEVGFEMLGYGLLVEMAIRYLPRYRNRNFFPYSALLGLCLGLSIEIGDSLYTLVVSFLSSVVAIVWAASTFWKAARSEGRKELFIIVAGLALALPTWLLAPDRLASVEASPDLGYEEFPYFGFWLLSIRILAAWTMLWGFWQYRLQLRIEDVAPQIQERLGFWGYRVLPGGLAIVVAASFLVTSWNGDRAMERMEREYISLAQAASLALDARSMAEQSDAEIGDQASRGVLAGQLLAIRRIGSDVRSVYLWRWNGREIRAFTLNKEQYGEPIVSRASGRLGEIEAFGSGEAFLLGPIDVEGRAALNISCPIIDKQTLLPVWWLGIDLAPTSWFRNVSLARLQSIIIAGLVLALLIFFFYYQIDHESEADLVLAKERAEAADRAKSEFLAVISHEIRTPLQSVLGYSDLLRSTPLNEKQHACLDTIQSEGKILLRIVQDILDFSNLRKANFELKEGPVPLRRLIDETFRTIKPMAERKGLAARLTVAEDVPELVVADGVRLRQVLLNVFGNSVKYTEQGSVHLSALVERDEPSGLPLKFEILDTGVGIRKEDLARLFEPFVQLEHTGKFPREGAGLGLAIVNRIVELMGGRIEVESKYGEGSKFTVSFDFDILESSGDELTPTRPTESSIAAEARMGKRFPLRIAVVDDNPMVRRLVAQYLESLGYEPDQLEGGRPASEKGHEYDVVILDLRMPDIDGPTAASIIRERTRDAERPWILAVSASLQENEVKRAKNAGVNDFLGKPFYASNLAERLREIPWFASVEVSEDAPQRPAATPPAGEPEKPVHRPIFIGPASPDEMTLPARPDSPPKADPVAASPKSVFGGIGSYPEAAVKAAVAEVYTIHDEMVAARQAEVWDLIREKAHYLANTAMALGIDQLYLDSKDLQHAAEAKDVGKIDKALPELRLNFEAWEQDE